MKALHGEHDVWEMVENAIRSHKMRLHYPKHKRRLLRIQERDTRKLSSSSIKHYMMMHSRRILMQHPLKRHGISFKPFTKEKTK